MNHKRFINSLLLAMALSVCAISAFAQGQSKVTPIKPAPVFTPRLPVAPVKWQVKQPVKPAPIAWQTKTGFPAASLNPLGRLPQTFVPNNTFEWLYTRGADTHPVQYERDSNGKTIYATGAYGPGTYTNPLLVLPQTGRRK